MKEIFYLGRLSFSYHLSWANFLWTKRVTSQSKNKKEPCIGPLHSTCVYDGGWRPSNHRIGVSSGGECVGGLCVPLLGMVLEMGKLLI